MEKEKKIDSLVSILLPSFLGLCLCAVCLAGGTFAWFETNHTVATQDIQMASFDVACEVSDKDGNIITDIDGVYPLSPSTYHVKLTSVGTASTGYCVLRLSGGEKLYTEQLGTDESATFIFVINEPAQLGIATEWGTLARSDVKIMGDGHIYTYGVENVTEDIESNEEDNTLEGEMSETSEEETEAEPEGKQEEVIEEPQEEPKQETE
ncbi:MAG: hypothetical protein Q4B31_03485 [Clostridia bacterium]|nr:hypothetical protein [Clostridia bacterium]